MALNKSTGLYNIPTHHLHGAKPGLGPSFNSMDFGHDSPEPLEPPKTKCGPGQPKKDSQTDSKREEKADKKKKKKANTSARDMQKNKYSTPSASKPAIKVTPATGSTKGKKRKRESEVPVPQGNPSDRAVPFVGTDMLKNIQSSVNASRGVFSSPPGPVQRENEPSKKKTKKDKASRQSGDTVDFDLIAKETRRIAKQGKKEKKAKRHSTGDVKARPTAPARAGAPSPPIFSSHLKANTPSPQVISSSAQATTVPVSQSAPVQALVHSPPPRKSHVPLPANAFSHRANASKVNRAGSKNASFPVAETPESRLPNTPVNLSDLPIPFKLTDAIKAKKSKKSKKATEMSPASPVEGDDFLSVPPALDKHHKLQLNPDGRVSLTASNLHKYMTTTQLLSDEPKPRPRAVSRAASTAGSTTSGGTTPSLKEMFACVGKPYSRSGAEIDPFVTPEVRKKVHRETHEEASIQVFNARFEAAQKAVNFTDEAEYLASFLAWRKANAALGPLPCLGLKASGCSAKKESALKLIRADLKKPLKALKPDTAATLLDDASSRATAAESLLTTSIHLRTPIPTGPLEGVWKLFCAPYSLLHTDKYGSGQRTLTLHSLPGASSPASSFTARLSIPPRSMLYAIRAFEVPPHASFRATRLRTSVEGYGMEVVFLGQGVLLLRADLRLLLSGKERAGEGVMEFVGVHERAVVWGEDEDEVEVVGRKLFAKYDGEA